MIKIFTHNNILLLIDHDDLPLLIFFKKNIDLNNVIEIIAKRFYFKKYFHPSLIIKNKTIFNDRPLFIVPLWVGTTAWQLGLTNRYVKS